MTDNLTRRRRSLEVTRNLFAAQSGDAATVCSLYRGPLLPNSQSPRIQDLRHQIEAVARRLLDHGTSLELLSFAEYQPWVVEILGQAVALSRREPFIHERA